eukprot:jgi/Mesvir1/16863/Mv15748-RA.1
MKVHSAEAIFGFRACYLGCTVLLLSIFIITGLAVATSGDGNANGLSVAGVRYNFSTPDSCSDGIFCNGVERRLSDGSCATSAFPVCDDRNPETIDSCVEETQTCLYEPTDGAVECLETCTPACEDKECGEDGCGGFCGSCPQGKGCQCSLQDADGNCIAANCVNATADGTCQSPIPFGPAFINVPAGGQLRVIQAGDSSNAFHAVSPQCNVASAAPELFYTFTIPQGRKYGVDIRASGYDTVLQLMSGCAFSNVIACSDDATPPGSLGSKVNALLPAGTYIIMMDGYSVVDVGPFTITARFVDNCLPTCDGNYCGDDGCGYKCGTCDVGRVCRNSVCYPGACEPKCAGSGRACGDDGCGGRCGECSEPFERCIGEGFQLDEEGNPPPSYCAAFPTCNHTHPVCTGCSARQYCGHDCQCYELDQRLPDFVLGIDDLEQELVFETVNVVNTSCAVRDGCVDGTGRRKLLRMTVTIMNQGAEWKPLGDLEVKDRPDIYDWSACNGHYKLHNFAQVLLRSAEDSRVIKSVRVRAYCLGDTERINNGSKVFCESLYNYCPSPGLSEGWLDRFGWSIECSWIDVTDVPPGNYLLEMVLNPEQQFQETSYANNGGIVPVYIPCSFPEGPVEASRTGPATCSAATGMMAALSSALLASVVAVGLAAILQVML